MSRELAKRKQNRIPDYNYAAAGAYYITFCTRGRNCVLRDEKKNLTEEGRNISEAIEAISEKYEYIRADRYIVMPDHVHVILEIDSWENKVSIETVINQTKRRASLKSGYSLWQKGYYEHVVRDSDDYRRICEYMENNPARSNENTF